MRLNQLQLPAAFVGPALFVLLISAATGQQNPACGLRNPPVCPLPQWEPTWQLNMSTIMQPANTSGFTNPNLAAQWGLASFDWSDARAIWYRGNRANTTMEATLAEQARLIKAINPQTKLCGVYALAIVFVYHNFELGLQWIESERAVMYDPTKANWFLQYTDGKGNKNGTIYNEPIEFGDQYFWDWRVPEVTQYWIDSIAAGQGGMGSPYVDGIFTDDMWGFPAEHPDAPANMKLSKAEVTAINQASFVAWQAVLESMLPKNGYIWGAFYGAAEDGTGGHPIPSNCDYWLTWGTNATVQDIALTMAWDTANKQQVLASFLIVRGPYAYLGYGWQGSVVPAWEPLWDTDVGTPLGLGYRVAPGIYARNYTKGSAVIDCNKWTAQLNF